MGKKIERRNRSKTLPSSPTHSFSSSSSSDFEFRISISPRKSNATLCPADELFYKGQLLPLHLSPRISMVRTLLLSSSSTSSSATATTTSRDSSSSTDSSASSANDFHLLAAACDSSRPSSAADDDHVLKRLHHAKPVKPFFSFTRIFKKDQSKTSEPTAGKKMSATAKEVFRKYFNKVRPLYEKLSHKQGQGGGGGGGSTAGVSAVYQSCGGGGGGGGTFSGSLKHCPRMKKRGYTASCPSSMRSSPCHSGVLTRAELPSQVVGFGSGSGPCLSDTATMEELQNAIQGAIAHCKNSLLQQNAANFGSHNSNIGSNKFKGKSIQI